MILYASKSWPWCDVTGYGRCSVPVALPIVSALKVPGLYPADGDPFRSHRLSRLLPRRLYGSHDAYIDSWKKNDLTFDGISTRLSARSDRSDMVLDFLRDFKGPDTKVIVDPSWAIMAASMRRIPRTCATK